MLVIGKIGHILEEVVNFFSIHFYSLGENFIEKEKKNALLLFWNLGQSSDIVHGSSLI